MTPKAEPLVSVVLPAHNEARWIESCIQGFLQQSYKHIEIIVVDDGSSDRTVEIAAQYPVRIIRHERCKGEAAARTTGSRAAKGDIVLHGEADARYQTDYIERGLRYFEDPEVMAVTCGEIRVLPEVAGLVGDYYRTRRRASFLLRNRGAKPAWGCHMVRRVVFERVGYYDSNCVVGCDADLARRIAQAGLKTVWGKDMYFEHADPGTLRVFLRRTYRGNLFSRVYQKKWGEWPSLPKQLAFLVWNAIVLLSPLCLLLAFWWPLVALVPVGFFLIEGVGAVLLHKDSRVGFGLALGEAKIALALSYPVLVFLRVRASLMGRTAAFLKGGADRRVSWEEEAALA
ncbi:MAG TPA: glycosyltransferase [Candidatus Thermoplasmatota archaeon]|nr:glycosyltransferase [Candidatus Thermoplasmatota archaeon]